MRLKRFRHQDKIIIYAITIALVINPTKQGKNMHPIHSGSLFLDPSRSPSPEPPLPEPPEGYYSDDEPEKVPLPPPDTEKVVHLLTGIENEDDSTAIQTNTVALKQLLAPHVPRTLQHLFTTLPEGQQTTISMTSSLANLFHVIPTPLPDTPPQPPNR